MLRKTTIALLAAASVAILAPSVASPGYFARPNGISNPPVVAVAAVVVSAAAAVLVAARRLVEAAASVLRLWEVVVSAPPPFRQALVDFAARR